MSQYPVVSGLLIGSPLSGKDVVDCRDAGADPALLQNALGITWDALELCLSYGLDFQQIKGVMVDGPVGSIEYKLRHNAVSGGNSRGEDMMGGSVTGDRGVVPEIGHVLVHQDALEDAVDGRVNGLIPRLLLGLRRIAGRVKGKSGGLGSVEQAGEPRTFAAKRGELEQDGVGGKFERSDTRLKFSLPVAVVASRRVHWWSPRKRPVTLP